jgi:hypothetical protein
MRVFFYILILSALCLLLQFRLPWWVIMPISFVMGYFLSPGKWSATWASFMGVFLVWVGMALFAESRSDISIAQLIGNVLGNIPGVVVILLTGTIGGICAGLGGLLGRWASELYSKPS